VQLKSNHKLIPNSDGDETAFMTLAALFGAFFSLVSGKKRPQDNGPKD